MEKILAIVVLCIYVIQALGFVLFWVGIAMLIAALFNHLNKE